VFWRRQTTKTNQLVFRNKVQDLVVDLVFANDGEAVVTALQTFKPDLIFMDISMPRRRMARKLPAPSVIWKKGRQTLLELSPYPPHAMPGDDQEVLEFGLDHYLTKPLRKLAIRSKRSEYRPREAKFLGPLTLV
jgi:CheY-like chemotaxis protein